MKKAALLLFLFLVIILVILGINTIRFTSKQIRAKPSKGIIVDVQKAAKRLSEAITFKTISTQDPRGMKACSEFFHGEKIQLGGAREFYRCFSQQKKHTQV